MKKILSVLMLIPMLSISQPTITKIVLGSNFNTTGFGGFGWTKQADVLYIIIICTTNAGGTPATISLTGSGETWTELGTSGGVEFQNKRLQAFRWYCTSNVGLQNTSVNYTGSGVQDGGWFSVHQVANADFGGTNGENAIVQVVTATDAATQHPNITMSALLNRASVLAGFMNDVNPPTGTNESGWSESEDGGYNDPVTGGYVIRRNNTNDNTPSWTAGAFSNWAGIAIEFKAAGRRVKITN